MARNSWPASLAMQQGPTTYFKVWPYPDLRFLLTLHLYCGTLKNTHHKRKKMVRYSMSALRWKNVNTWVLHLEHFLKIKLFPRLNGLNINPTVNQRAENGRGQRENLQASAVWWMWECIPHPFQATASYPTPWSDHIFISMSFLHLSSISSMATNFHKLLFWLFLYKILWYLTSLEKYKLSSATWRL